MQAAIATDRPEAVSCPLRRSHGALPVGIDPELVRSERERLVARTELDRIVRELGEPLLEPRNGLTIRETTDLDPRDLRPLGELLARTGERQTDEDSDHHEQPRDDREGEERRPALVLSSRSRQKDGRIGAHPAGDSTRAGEFSSTPLATSGVLSLVTDLLTVESTSV